MTKLKDLHQQFINSYKESVNPSKLEEEIKNLAIEDRKEVLEESIYEVAQALKFYKEVMSEITPRKLQTMSDVEKKDFLNENSEVIKELEASYKDINKIVKTLGDGINDFNKFMKDEIKTDIQDQLIVPATVPAISDFNSLKKLLIYWGENITKLVQNAQQISERSVEEVVQKVKEEDVREEGAVPESVQKNEKQVESKPIIEEKELPKQKNVEKQTQEKNMADVNVDKELEELEREVEKDKNLLTIDSFNEIYPKINKDNIDEALDCLEADIGILYLNNNEFNPQIEERFNNTINFMTKVSDFLDFNAEKLAINPLRINQVNEFHNYVNKNLQLFMVSFKNLDKNVSKSKTFQNFEKRINSSLQIHLEDAEKYKERIRNVRSQPIITEDVLHKKINMLKEFFNSTQVDSLRKFNEYLQNLNNIYEDINIIKDKIEIEFKNALPKQLDVKVELLVSMINNAIKSNEKISRKFSDNNELKLQSLFREKEKDVKAFGSKLSRVLKEFRAKIGQLSPNVHKPQDFTQSATTEKVEPEIEVKPKAQEQAKKLKGLTGEMSGEGIGGIEPKLKSMLFTKVKREYITQLDMSMELPASNFEFKEFMKSFQEQIKHDQRMLKGVTVSHSEKNKPIPEKDKADPAKEQNPEKIDTYTFNKDGKELFIMEKDGNKLTMTAPNNTEKGLAAMIKTAKEIAKKTGKNIYKISGLNKSNVKEAMQLYVYAMSSGLRPEFDPYPPSCIVSQSDDDIKKWGFNAQKELELLEKHRNYIYTKEGKKADPEKSVQRLVKFRSLVTEGPDLKAKPTQTLKNT